MKKYSSTFFYAVVFFAILLQFYLGQTAYFADAEYWVTSLSLEPLSSWRDAPSLAFKPFFHLLLRLPEVISNNPLNYIYINRGLYSLFFIFIIYLVYKISEFFFEDEKWKQSSILVLFLQSTFLTYALQIRSDLLAVVFYLLSICCLLEYRKENNKTYFSASVLFAFIMCLCTPKFILFLPPIIALALMVKPNYKKIILPSLIAALLLLVGVAYSFPHKLAFEYFVNGFSGSEVEYLSFKNFHYFIISIKKNPFFYFVLFLSFVWPIYKSILQPQRSDKEKWLYFSSLYSLLVFVVMPDKLPFFLASLIPQLSLFFVVSLKQISLCLSAKRKLVFTYALVFVALWQVLIAASEVQHIAKVNNNKQQSKYLKNLTNYLDNESKVTFFDGTGLIPKTKSKIAYIGYGQRDLNRKMFHLALSRNPDFVLQIGKMYKLDEFSSFNFLSRYLELKNGVWIAGDRIKKKEELELSFDLNTMDSHESVISKKALCMNYFDNHTFGLLLENNKKNGIRKVHEKCIGPINRSNYQKIYLPSFEGYYFLTTDGINFPIPDEHIAKLFGFEIAKHSIF